MSRNSFSVPPVILDVQRKAISFSMPPSSVVRIAISGRMRVCGDGRCTESGQPEFRCPHRKRSLNSNSCLTNFVSAVASGIFVVALPSMTRGIIGDNGPSAGPDTGIQCQMSIR
jgi:hypothetical protein